MVGVLEGVELGTFVGAEEGTDVGPKVGASDGSCVGTDVGTPVGVGVAFFELRLVESPLDVAIFGGGGGAVCAPRAANLMILKRELSLLSQTRDAAAHGSAQRFERRFRLPLECRSCRLARDFPKS